MSRLALSTATGSVPPIMPISGIIGVSFLDIQSQFLVILYNRFMYTILESSAFFMPKAYSTIFSWNFTIFSSYFISIAPVRQITVHSPQPMHLSFTNRAFFFLIPMALAGHISMHEPQPMHLSAVISGRVFECCSSLPAREAQPIPRFLRAPAKPVCMCPVI